MLTDLLLCLAGVAAGAMNAIAGGGMLVTFPALLAAGLPALSANATGYLITLPGQITAVYGYRGHLKKVPRQYMWLLLPSAAGALIGSFLLRSTPRSRFEDLIPELIGFAVVLFAFQPLLHFHLHQHLASRRKPAKPLLLIGLAMLPVAIYGGYFGAGFGFIMLAFLGFTGLQRAHQIQALKNLAASVMAFVSVLVLANGSFIDWRQGGVMALGTAVGGYFGARLAQYLPAHLVRLPVIALGIITAAYLALHSSR